VRLRISHVGERARGTVRGSHVGDLKARSEVSHVGEADADARLALTTLGFRKAVAIAAVAKARYQVGRAAVLETLVRAALRECPR